MSLTNSTTGLGVNKNLKGINAEDRLTLIVCKGDGFNWNGANWTLYTFRFYYAEGSAND